MSLITNNQWNAFNDIMLQAHNTYMTHTITWKKSNQLRGRWGEDNPNEGFLDYPLRCLMNYNYLRTWPSTQHTESGELEMDSIQIYFSKFHLAKSNHLDAQGNFNYSPDADRFIINGKVYKAEGGTDVSQSSVVNDSLLVAIVVKPETVETGNIPR